jgi:pSer/pThr/pTyr-binding forkhead associated (FHA) protein
MDGSQMLKVIEYDTPKPIKNMHASYIVLESVSTSVSKVIHVVNMIKQRKFFFGRGNEADVRVTDISVSRLHASVFKSAQGYFYLCDNKSKFGTLL